MAGERREMLEQLFNQAEAGEELDPTVLQGDPDEEIGGDGDQTQGTDDQGAGEDLGAEGEGAEGSEEGAQAKPPKKAEKADPIKVEQQAAQRKDKKAKPAIDPKTGKPAAETPPPTQSDIKAPQSWTPEERANWAKVPLDAQKAIQRRELQVQQALSHSDGSRRFQSEFVNTVKPYAHLIRAQGSTPLAAVDNLMRTAAGLSVGSAQQKAAIVAEIIQNYGVNIQELDNVLFEAQKNPRGNANAGRGAIDPAVAQALAPVHQFMEQQEQIRSQNIQRIQDNAVQTVEQFKATGKAEYFDDVKDDVADILEIAAARGREITLQEAYDRAILMNPAIHKVVQQKEALLKQQRDPAAIARKRRAAASVKGAPRNGAAGQQKPTSRRQALADAWDDAT